MNIAPTPEYMEVVGRLSDRGKKRFSFFDWQAECWLLRESGDSVRDLSASNEKQHVQVFQRWPHLYLKTKTKEGN